MLQGIQPLFLWLLGRSMKVCVDLFCNMLAGIDLLQSHLSYLLFVLQPFAFECLDQNH